ncbi:MAG: tyrosine-type recombinase/integrase [Beijerinckiaceae bacterium]|nr:tyrosine-type recombinase/integrase [Beijerinckiaceae bacterium]
MPRPRPPYLHHETTRHGAQVWYVRREHGHRIRLRAPYNSPEFWREYRAALEGSPVQSAAPKIKPQTLAWAIERYRASSAWAGLAVATRRQRENIYRAVIQAAGAAPLTDLHRDAIMAGRERRAATPHSANNFLKAMRGFFGWAAGDGKLVSVDPTKGVSLLKGANDDTGFHTWTEEEVERFEARWPVGTRERLALDILLYTGLRRGDAVRVGRQHVREGVITIRAEKTREQLVLPILAPLAASIAATKTGTLTYLATERGTPFVKESFGTWFRKACTAAKCPGSAHGLRKAGATRAANNSASDRELMALFGWSTAKMATHYTRSADQQRLARQASEKLLLDHNRNEKCPHQGSGGGADVETPRKTGA